MSTPFLSIITVVYNAEKNLENTISSITSQKNVKEGEFEYIVIDGASTDGTLKVIEEYSNYISQQISEPDKGIYDAMNKGINMATGNYIWFLNAGDELYNTETLSLIMSCLKSNPDVVYGDTMNINITGKEIGLRRLRPPKVLSWKSFKKGMLVCHQALIIKTNLISKYNTKYAYSSDFDWVIKALKKSKNIVNTNHILCRYLEGGLTEQNLIKSLIERYKIMVFHYGLIPASILNASFIFRLIFFYSRHKRI